MSRDPLAAPDGGSSCGREPEIESFVSSLRASGYAGATIHRKKEPVLKAFASWMRGRRLLSESSDADVAAFLRRRHRRTRYWRGIERGTLTAFVRYLRAATECVAQPNATPSPITVMVERYGDYLRRDRGLTQRSVQVYTPFIEEYLTARATKTGSVSLGDIGGQDVREFLLERSRDLSSEYTRLRATALRSFLRFLFLRGETERDLSFAIPPVIRWSRAPVHAFFQPSEVERILSATDRSTPRGRCDHAILLLLARLGLRAGEVVALELDDIRWRTGEIVVRGKGQMLDVMPLLADVGKALATYIKRDRGTSGSRRVFLRKIAPRVGLAGPAAIGGVVRSAVSRAGLVRPHRGAAHLLRHSLATMMIRHGASIPEISKVLRHRAAQTTEIYAKVSFETLREVARPWPGAGGAR